MTHMKLKLSAAGVIFAGALAYLGFAGMQAGMVYTLPVDQYVHDAKSQSQRVRLCGTVAEKDLEMNKARLWAKFVLKGDKESVPVYFKGVIPDMFKAGGEVVVEGKRAAGGVFEADVLMTKCASKYQEQPQGHPKVPQEGRELGTGGQE
jgi:cytochrome c-type biogenesis protein CcmE